MKRVVVGIKGTRQSLIYDVDPNLSSSPAILVAKTAAEKDLKEAREQTEKSLVLVKMFASQEPDIWIDNSCWE